MRVLEGGGHPAKERSEEERKRISNPTAYKSSRKLRGCPQPQRTFPAEEEGGKRGMLTCSDGSSVPGEACSPSRQSRCVNGYTWTTTGLSPKLALVAEIIKSKGEKK